jgi:hypothetical protein
MRKLFVPFAIVVLMLMGLGHAAAQTFDISSGGAATITGTLNGSVTGSSSVLNNLVVTVNFGELSPSNGNGIIKVVVPIAIRSTQAYKVTVTLTGSSNVNPQAIQATDVGFGANNIRSMGSQAKVCTRSSHTFVPLFNNDPSTTVFIAANGRAAYSSDLSDISTSTTILSGPRLSNTSSASRQSNNGYIFNAIFAITPQFYAASTENATLTFTIASTTGFSC